MSGIFTRWRQFSRRYFWPHLLLGMVAASVGLPVLLNSAQAQSNVPPPATHKPGANHPLAANAVKEDSLQQTDAIHHALAHQARLYLVAYHLSFATSRWQQRGSLSGAIYTLSLHKLSFSLPLPVLSLAHGDQARQLALSGLAYLADLQVVAQPLDHYINTSYFHRPPLTVSALSRWIRQAQGIRAGPVSRPGTV